MDEYIPCRESDIPDGIRFDVPRRNAGQIVTVSYGGLQCQRTPHSEGAPYMHVHDASCSSSDPERDRWYKLR